MYENFIDKKVLVRSYDAGVYFGTLKEVEGDAVRMENVRNIWEWGGAPCLSQIANDGIKGGKVSPMVQSMVLLKVCQILPLCDKAIDNLERKSEWKF